MAAGDVETEVSNHPPAPPVDGLAQGTLLNGMFRIERRLGKGGMGEVYLATNLANDEQDAIKIIGRGRAGDTYEALFRKEARVLSRIRSPAITQLKLFMRDPALDLLYFVTEFVPGGESLLDRLRRQPGSPDELRLLLRRVLTGLHAVHEAGAVHRDLSPDNIMLPGGDLGQAKIIDFGIVKELDPDKGTIIGDTFAGKFGFIAPEQLPFSGIATGPWTDLYALGLVGLTFAAGKTLYMGSSPATAEETRRQPADLAAVPADLRPLFTRLLQFEWRKRPQSAAEALAILDSVYRAPPPQAPAEPIPAPLLPTPATDIPRETEPVPHHRDGEVETRPPRRLATGTNVRPASGVLRRPLLWSLLATCLTLVLAGLAYFLVAPNESELAREAQGPGVITTSSGLQYKVLIPGDPNGVRPTSTDVALVNYRIRLLDGSTVDQAQQVPLPLKMMQAGVAEGLHLMSKHAKYRLWMKPSLAGAEEWRSSDGKVIPANKVKVMDVELLDIASQEQLREMGVDPSSGDLAADSRSAN